MLRKLILLLSLCVWGAPSAALAEGPELGPNDLRSVFFVSKSSNGNRVHYALRLDGDCHPAGEEPVVPYWEIPGDAPDPYASLSMIEALGYGTKRQETRLSPSGGAVRVVFRALSSRPVVFVVRRGREGCEARAILTVAGVSAYLDHVHLELTAPLQLDHAELKARRESDGSAVEEWVSP